MIGGNPTLPSTMRNLGLLSTFLGGQSPPVFKTNLCNKYNNAAGCSFGDKCHFAHLEWKLRKPTVPSHHEDPCVMGLANTIRFGGDGPPCMDFDSAYNHVAVDGL
ncbi:hypothetical protein R6Q59_022885 [Mikania micrantha]